MVSPQAEPGKGRQGQANTRGLRMPLGRLKSETGMISGRRFLLFIVGLILLPGCGVKTSKPIFQTISMTPTISYLSSAFPSLTAAAWCTSFIRVNNLPVSDELRDSHIVYTAFAGNPAGEVVDQDWTLSLKDGFEKLSPGAFPSPWTDSGRYIDSQQYALNGNGHSLNSPDGQHIAIWKNWFMTYGSSDTPTLIIQDRTNGRKVEIFRGSPGDELSGVWSPKGSLFVFTYYNDIPEYYSMVYIVNADGTGLKPLTGQMKSITFDRPRWSPDGNKIAVPVYDTGVRNSILIIDLRSGDVTKFSAGPYINMGSTIYGNWVEQGNMTWSPDGQWFAYISVYSHIGLEILNTESGKIYCIDNDEGVSIHRLLWQYDIPWR